MTYFWFAIYVILWVVVIGYPKWWVAGAVGVFWCLRAVWLSRKPIWSWLNERLK